MDASNTENEMIQQIKENDKRVSKEFRRAIIYGISGFLIANYSSEINDLLSIYMPHFKIHDGYIAIGGLAILLKASFHNLLYNIGNIREQSIEIKEKYYHSLENVVINHTKPG